MMFSLLVPASCLSWEMGVVRRGRLSTGAGAILMVLMIQLARSDLSIRIFYSGTSALIYYQTMLNPRHSASTTLACAIPAGYVLSRALYILQNPAIRLIPVQQSVKRSRARPHPMYPSIPYITMQKYVHRLLPPRGFFYANGYSGRFVLFIEQLAEGVCSLYSRDIA